MGDNLFSYIAHQTHGNSSILATEAQLTLEDVPGEISVNVSHHESSLLFQALFQLRSQEGLTRAAESSEKDAQALPVSH